MYFRVQTKKNIELRFNFKLTLDYLLIIHFFICQTNNYDKQYTQK